MTADHHDAELCKRLATKVMGWKYLRLDTFDTPLFKHGPKRNDNRHFDPCCNPAHSWMLEQRMAELGWEYQAFQGAVKFFNGIDEGPLFEAANRLASTAVAADEVTK